jgi:lysozyme
MNFWSWLRPRPAQAAASPAPPAPIPAPPPAPATIAGLPDGVVWLLEQFEGRKLRPYLCPAGVPTIGIGTTRYPDGCRVTMADPPITAAQAEAYALDDLREAAEDANAMTKGVPLSRCQRGALALFVHNLGPGALADSTLLRMIRAGQIAEAAPQFDRWNKARDPRTRQLVVLKGLSRRRRAERLLFEGVAPAAAYRRALADFP